MPSVLCVVSPQLRGVKPLCRPSDRQLDHITTNESPTFVHFWHERVVQCLVRGDIHYLAEPFCFLQSPPPQHVLFQAVFQSLQELLSRFQLFLAFLEFLVQCACCL